MLKEENTTYNFEITQYVADRGWPAFLLNVKDEVEVSTSPAVSEFISDAFDSCKINEDDLRKEVQQLVLDQKEHPNTQQGESFGFTGGW